MSRLVDLFVARRTMRRRTHSVYIEPTRAAMMQQRPAPANGGETEHRTEHLAIRSLRIFGIGIGVLIIGLATEFVVVGETLIIAYTVAAIWRHTDSRLTFLLALSCLAVMAIVIILGNSALADNFGVYAFLLLASGATSLLFELRGRE